MPEQRVESVERALSILEAFDEGHSALSLADLARRTGFYKSTILRLLASLMRRGFVSQGEDGLYRLGPSVWRLGSLYRRGFDLGEHVRPTLRKLVEATGETASFYIRQGNERVCLYRQNSPKAIRHHLDEGVRLPLDRGAPGRVLLAFSGQRGKIYDMIRAKGEYVSLGERDPEIGAAAVPVFDAGGQLRGALSVSALLSRFTKPAQASALKALRKAAQELSMP